MKTHHHLLLLILPLTFVLAGEGRAVSPFRAQSATVSQPPRADDPMSPAYYEKWSPEVQASIDRDIEKFRKAGAVIKLPAHLPVDADIKIEQLTHDFIFGAHIFNFGQLGTPERNQKYRDLFGPFFNSATIAFYWREFELEEGKLRFAAGPDDTEEFWNDCKEPKKQPHWRRPPTDPVVAFCESRGIRMHGHPLVWGSNVNWPRWFRSDSKYCPENEREKLAACTNGQLAKMPLEKIVEMAPVYSKNIAALLEKRIAEIAARYGSRIHSWDVVNESATRRYPLPLPSDYVFQGFEMTQKYLPQTALLNINDFEGGWQYPKQVNDLRARGAKIDIMGKQMHLFKLDSVRKIAAGNYKHDMLWPDNFHEIITKLTKANLPLHFSEITIPAPDETPEGFEMQAIVAKNLYRLWFSSKPVMGITWWNAVDGCGYGNEPAISGLFTRDMQPKPAYHALNQLINHDWKTNLTIKNPGTGSVTFRGFKGNYKITCNDWTTTIHVK